MTHALAPADWFALTKLAPPTLRADSIERPGLLARLAEAVDHHALTLIAAPAGSGKTTLLRLIAGEIHPDDGGITVPKSTRIGWVTQEAPGGPDSLIAVVLAADKERARLLAEADTAHDPHRIAEIHERLADIGAHAAPARAARILSGLGFDEEAQQRCGEDGEAQPGALHAPEGTSF